MVRKHKQPSTGMRTFYILILTQVFSLIGSRISGLAIGIWVYAQTGNATPLALVAFFAVVPQVVASGASGVLADRYDRRYVMVLADAGQAFGTLLLLISFLSGDFRLWHLYAVTLIQAVFAVFQGPALGASITMLVPEEKRDSANALIQLTGPSAGIIGPAVTGFIYAAVGVTGAILIDLLTFLVAVAVVLGVHIPRPEQTEEGRAMQGTVWKEALGGLSYLWSRRTLFFLLLHISLLNFLISGAGVLLTPYILARTGSETTLGLLMSVMNVGAIAGGVLMSVWGGTRPRIHTIMPGIIVAGLFMIGIGMGQSALAMGLFMLLLMVPIPMINAAFSSMLQTKVAPDIQGRVFAVVGQLSLMMSPIAYLLAGPLADTVFEPAVGTPGWSRIAPLVGNGTGAGMGLIMVIGGGLAVVTTVIVYALPRIRSLEADLPDYTPVIAAEELLPEASPSLTDTSPLT